MTTFLDIYEIFFSLPRGKFFSLVWKRIILYFIPASNLTSIPGMMFFAARRARLLAGTESPQAPQDRQAGVPLPLQPHAGGSPCPVSLGKVAEASLHLGQQDALATSFLFFLNKTFPAARWRQCSISSSLSKAPVRTTSDAFLHAGSLPSSLPSQSFPLALTLGMPQDCTERAHVAKMMHR